MAGSGVSRVPRVGAPDERLAHFYGAAREAGLGVRTLRTEAEGARHVSILEVELAEVG